MVRTGEASGGSEALSAIHLDDAVREALRRLLDQYGPDLIRDRTRLAGLLRDECGQHKREINLLLDALDEHVVETLRSPSQVLLLVTIPSCARRLHEARGTDATAARWAVESWAHALGLLDEGSLHPSDQLEAASVRETHRRESADPNAERRKPTAVPRARSSATNKLPRAGAIGVAVLLIGYFGWQAVPRILAPVESRPPAELPPSQDGQTSDQSKPPPPPGREALVDPRLIASWRTHFTNQHGQWTFVFTPEPDGRYRTTVRGPFAWPDDAGTIVARNGRWDARKGNGEREGGSYEFRDDKTVIFKGHGPAVTWERMNPS